MTIELFEPLTKPTAAQLNAISAAQTALNATYAGAASETVQIAHSNAQHDVFVLRHTYRWLLFDSTGELVDLSGVNDPVNIPDPETGFGVKDLDEIDWLTVGMFYKITGCEFAYEKRDPPGA